MLFEPHQNVRRSPTWTVAAAVAVVCVASLRVGFGLGGLGPVDDRQHKFPTSRRSVADHKDSRETGNGNRVTTLELNAACPDGDVLCPGDPFGFEAIQLLHAQIDDDQNGNVDRDESNEFLRDDLKHEGAAQTTDFHGGDDLISVQDLWKLWSTSDVYRWTVDDVVEWLTTYVELPQYASNFRINEVDGHTLPRLTSLSPHSLVGIIGVKNPVHRQKIALKAVDLVLFGPPKHAHSFAKDLALATSLALAVAGCYLAYAQHRKAKFQLDKVMHDLAALQKAETALGRLQDQLKKAQIEQQIVTSAKRDVEEKLKSEIETAKAEAARLRSQRERSAQEKNACLALAEDELIQLRKALNDAERQLQNRLPLVTGHLQQWLQLTYEVETRYFEAERVETEKELKEAREMCNKIRKQKEKFFGAFQVAHTTSLDDTDDKILRVREALDAVKKDLQERTCRWKEIENVCGFNIITNPGIPYLNSLLRRPRYFSHPDRARRRSLGKKRGSAFSACDENEMDDDMSSFLFQIHNSKDLPRVMSLPGNASRQVVPNLMRAGMQLSVFGVNLSGMNAADTDFARDRHPSPVISPLFSCGSEHSLLSIGSLSQSGGSLTPNSASVRSLTPTSASVRSLTPTLASVRSLTPTSASVRSLTPTLAAVRTFPALPSAPEFTEFDGNEKGIRGNDNEKAIPESNGFVYDISNDTWKSSATSDRCRRREISSRRLNSEPDSTEDRFFEENAEKVEQERRKNETGVAAATAFARAQISENGPTSVGKKSSSKSLKKKSPFSKLLRSSANAAERPSSLF